MESNHMQIASAFKEYRDATAALTEAKIICAVFEDRCSNFINRFISTVRCFLRGSPRDPDEQLVDARVVCGLALERQLTATGDLVLLLLPRTLSHYTNEEQAEYLTIFDTPSFQIR